MDRKTFFANVRKMPFGNNLSQQKVDGCSALLDAYERRYPNASINHKAYVLATAFHETAGTMDWSIREYGKGQGRPYGKPDATTGKVYYGRGYCQITWLANYGTMSHIVDVNLVSNPDAALEKENSATIIIEGMERGLFTGKKLSDFFSDDKADAVNARTIINGHDRASMIARYYESFHKALEAAVTPAGEPMMLVTKASGAQADVPDSEEDIVDQGKPLTESKVIGGGGLMAAAGVAGPFLGNITSGYTLAAFGIIVAVALVAGLVLVFFGRKEIKYKFGV